MSSPRVSVCMVTFEQEAYVDEALRSALTQDLEDIEVVVGDDASSDGTRAVIHDWATRDARVRVLPHEPKFGPRANYMRTLAECRGRYVSQLDGDDYWTDPRKLRLQADLLDGEADCALCFSASQEVNEVGAPLAGVMRPPQRRARYTIEDFAVMNLSNSNAMMWRRGVFGAIPEWFKDAPVGDWPMHMLHAEHGDIAYIDTNMAAHRNHARGIWAGKDLLARMRVNLGCHACFLTHLRPSTVERIRPAIVHHQFRLAKRYELAGQLALAQEIVDWLRIHGKGDAPAPTRG